MTNSDSSDRLTNSSTVNRDYFAAPALFALLLTVFLVEACSESRTAGYAGPPLYASQAAMQSVRENRVADSVDYDQFSDLKIPPLPPEKALQTFDLEEGFRIEIVAHEPDVVDPIAMDIDPDGRLWVVEMRSYMPVYDQPVEETSEMERVPHSRIVVLEDTTEDGRTDHSWTFMDGLVLPRAIKVLDDGVLVAEPPHVWFIQDTTGDGIGDTKEMVFSNYGDPDSDNVEHMDNGLMWAMDNWIYSVYSDVSFRRVEGHWETRPFEQLSQWGITQDSWGRLYSTHNSRTLLAHLVPYGYSHRHPEFRLEAGITSSIAESETMWPAHPTGVNRGYRVNEIVREDGTLKRSTSTCGPVIYRGDQFGASYRGNAFVAEPAGNLIKRLVGLDENPGGIEAEARFAYEEKEFLTSTDERFRPVNLYNAPDGSIYVVDMYRGIFQHAQYLTDFLREYAVKHDLHKPLGKSRFGRIYRIVRNDRDIDYDAPRLRKKNPGELAGYMAHENGALRDAAQQLLVQRSPAEAVPQLEEFVRDRSGAYYTRLQALWTLDGFDEERYGADRRSRIAMTALDDPHPRVRAAAIRILEPEVRHGTAKVLRRLKRMAAEEKRPYPRLQLLASIGEAPGDAMLETVAEILNEHADNPYFLEMGLTGVYGRESELLAILRQKYGWRQGMSEETDAFLEHLSGEVGESTGPEVALSGEARRLYNLGRQQFGTCMACHGESGAGMEGVAPPLAGSSWVNGDKRALTRILLQGFNRDDEESTVIYPGVMPSHRFLTDEEVAAVLTYIRNSWGNDGSPVTMEEVSEVRETTANRQKEWTPEELAPFSN